MEIQYIVVEASKKEALEAEVQSRLNNGWTLQGGVCLDGIGMGTRRYVQALILRSE